MAAKNEQLETIKDDIKYLEKLGMGAQEIFDKLEQEYAAVPETILIRAFRQCGYEVD